MDATRLVEAFAETGPEIGEEAEERVIEAELALGAGGDLFGFLRPLLRELDEKLDLRLVRTLANVVLAIIRNWNQPFGLPLSELGALLVGPAHAPAGIKRLANLVHCERWQECWRVVQAHAQRWQIEQMLRYTHWLLPTSRQSP